MPNKCHIYSRNGLKILWKIHVILESMNGLAWGPSECCQWMEIVWSHRRQALHAAACCNWALTVDTALTCRVLHRWLLCSEHNYFFGM